MNIQTLWKENSDFVLKICLRYVNSIAEAEDIRQDVFLKIITSQNIFKKQSSVKTWLYSITHNCCMDYFRTVKRQRSVTKEYLRKEKFCMNDSRSPIWKVNKISEMPCPISQLFIELHFGDGWSKEEIAQVFGFTVDHINKRMQIGIQQLRKMI
jgi:RNA polymerase sigma-70 factor (ECF subfamily)